MSTTTEEPKALLTITEGLAEIKTLKKRVSKTQEFILRNLTRPSKMKDPLEADGGSEDAIKNSRQSISDMTKRIIRIRTAIQASNLENRFDLEGEDMSVAAWLVYRRDIEGIVGGLLNSMSHTIEHQRTRGRIGHDTPDDITVSISEKELADSMERHEKILGALDGRLSLHNATTTISVS